ncbi:uncharacterized protein LOC131164837 isoform X1 [Malania oleifera]|uniref:uncharacterized protein LOC131164837 isoform X1 n=1 Tax=Malania oleifera TaxID=397392 RepID=UPI0025ADB6BF|nr:uncharacterized protein LOC131164837 isoform X1 [Malania oleifera]XP_057978323.1 uncharacterized protein LOC131164837 isoform X1 [Malania oleifera]XP_057978324.1 uncharacterized protein LOC131164837 isoform X1 [Malania oleifera]XP_057978325.1 uncharacterized protein LOC131164837 isoform X1 [Malania oleifera]XP_057978326.1 uncharacterized protein LOC131164837 isoform X1 [Malania oleifera]
MKYVKPLKLFSELLKKDAIQQRRLLGLDVGNKYVGLAVSDPLNIVACPLSVLMRTKDDIDLMASDFQTMISELSVSGFVVGCAFDRFGKCPDVAQVKIFIDDLCKTGKLEGLKYTFWNESLTSKAAELLLKPLKLHPVMSKAILDKFAAVGILQDYLDTLNRSMKLKSVTRARHSRIWRL